MSHPPIDTDARRRGAEIYRHFASGRLTNDELENCLPPTREWALDDIFFLGIWPLYDDRYEHRLAGKHRLTREGRRYVARIVLFLRCGLPYRWPRSTGFKTLGDSLIALMTLGLYRPYKRRWQASGGEEAVWPFFDQAEHDAAIRKPTLLTGDVAT
jgi:hypothetical protein